MAGMTLWINLRATLRGEKLVTYWPQAKRRFFSRLEQMGLQHILPSSWVVFQSSKNSEINKKKHLQPFSVVPIFLPFQCFKKEHLRFCLFHPGGVILIHLGGLLPGLIESGWWQLYRFTGDFGNAWHLVMASKRLDWSTMDVELLWRWEWWNFVDWWCFSVLFMAMLCFLLQGLHVCRTSKCLVAVSIGIELLQRFNRWWGHFCPCFSSSSFPTQSWS